MKIEEITHRSTLKAINHYNFTETDLDKINTFDELKH